MLWRSPPSNAAIMGIMRHLPFEMPTELPLGPASAGRYGMTAEEQIFLNLLHAFSNFGAQSLRCGFLIVASL